MKKTTKNKKSVWWKSGIRFQCQGSGNCCSSHGEYGYVYLTDREKKALARHLKMNLSDFIKKYCCYSEELYHLKSRKNGSCIFLKNKRCTIYALRPFQCRTGPFWPETLINRKTWKKDVANLCPGVGKGPLFTYKQICRLLQEHDQWEDELAQTKS